MKTKTHPVDTVDDQNCSKDPCRRVVVLDRLDEAAHRHCHDKIRSDLGVGLRGFGLESRRKMEKRPTNEVRDL